MITLRNIPTAIVLIALSTISLLSAWQVIGRGLDQESIGDPDRVFAWLAHHDAKSLPHETQLKVVRRLEQQLRNGADPVSQLAGLPSRQQTQFRANIDALTSLWLKQKVDGYFARREKDRGEYIDRELAAILRWPMLVRFADGEDSQTAATAGLIGQLIELAPLMERLIEQTEPAEQQRIHEFIVAVQNRAAAQKLFGSGRRRLD